MRIRNKILGHTVVSVITATRFKRRTKATTYPNFALFTNPFSVSDKEQS